MTLDPALLERVRSRLAADGGDPSAAALTAALRAEGAVVAERGVPRLAAELRAELTGLGPLEPLVADPAVTDVLVNGPGEVWVERAGRLERATVRLADEDAVRRLAQRLARQAGRRLDDSVPYVDGRLRDGIRLHAVLPPVSPRGTVLSLRLPRRIAFRLDELVRAGSLAPALAAVLTAVVRARLPFVVSGATGAGKTTLLGCLLGLAAPSERMVLVEDSGELQPDHPHVVRLEARQPNVEGAGRVDLRDLVRQAMRMRPDRLVVGEVRGAEVLDLLAALNTGHEGGCGTVHANAAVDVPARLEALAAQGGVPRDALHSQLAAALRVVVHVARASPAAGGGRRVAEIGVLARGPAGWCEVRPALVADGSGALQDGPGAGHLRALLEEWA